MESPAVSCTTRTSTWHISKTAPGITQCLNVYSLVVARKIWCNVGCILSQWNLYCTQPTVQRTYTAIHYTKVTLVLELQGKLFQPNSILWKLQCQLRACIDCINSSMEAAKKGWFCNPSKDTNVMVRTACHAVKKTMEYQLWWYMAHTTWATKSLSSIYLQTRWKLLQELVKAFVAHSIHSGELIFLKQPFDMHLPIQTFTN